MKKSTAKRFLCLLLAFPFALPCAGCAKRAPEPAPREYNEQGYRLLPFSHGINLSCMEYPWYFTMTTYWKMKKSRTYEDIVAQGFDHVRVPVDFRLYYDADKKELKKSFLRRLDSMIAKAETAGLYVCLDFHGWNNINTDKPEHKETFVTIWRLLAEHYKDASDYVIFELLNEPHTNEGGNLDSKRLNALQNETIAAIRETNPDRLILAATADWNGWWTLGDLRLPTGDKNIAVAVHTYTPLKFTHQGATWGDPNNTFRVPLTQDMLLELKSDLDHFMEFTNKTGVQVVLNEFGVHKGVVDPADTTKYLAFLSDYCRENGLAWTVWNYWEYGGNGFGATKNGKWRDDVMNGLFPERAKK